MKSRGIEIVFNERLRQIEIEGWTPEHDAEHTDESLPRAAACYAMPEEERKEYASFIVNGTKEKRYPRWWLKSWDVSWWKPTADDRIKELAKAGALIVAEIDRLLTIEKKSELEYEILFSA